MLLNCSCKSFLNVQLNCWCNGKVQQPARAKDLSIVYLCIFMLIYHDLHCLSPSPSLQNKKKKKSSRSFASSPFHHSLPQLGPPRQLPQLGTPRQLSLLVTKICAPRLPSKNFDRCMFGFPLKLFPAPF